MPWSTSALRSRRGAILCMLSDTFMPKAFKEGGDKVGLVTVFGFALAALLSTT